MENVQALIDLISLEKINEAQFQGNNFITPWRRVFGGQVLGQSLNAAYQSVPDDRFVHSFHGYFILTGNVDIPITYEVDTIRDGGSFSTRRVVASQEGKAIFIMAASFQLEQEGFNHQINMPNVLPPDVLLPDYEQVKHLKTSAPDLYKRLTIVHPNAIEFRPVENLTKYIDSSSRPYRHVWFKAKSPINDDLRLHHQILAYASDYNLLTTAVLPHQDKIERMQTFLASLDHAIYFHRKFRVDEWLLYATDSPSASNSRGFSRGNIFDLEGRLVASVIQEGLIRKMRK